MICFMKIGIKMNKTMFEFYKRIASLISISVMGFVLFCWSINFFWAKYHIWHQRQVGQAELARAEGNRAIAICEAKAAQESAQCYAEAEIIRARGVAEANRIIGDSLKDNESYLKYRFIEGLQTNQMQTIYLPHDGLLPVTESTRFLEYDKSRKN